MDLYPLALGRADWGSSLSDMEPFLQQTGFRNFEIHPTTRIRDEVLYAQTVDARQMIGALVGSMHQTFNSGQGVFGRIADNRGVRRMGDSVLDMQAMQLNLARNLPMVVYPKSLPKELLPLAKWGITAMQPNAEDYAFLRDSYPELGDDVYTNEGLMEANRRLGISYLCPDTVHSRRKSATDDPVPDIERVWRDQFASGKVVQMHVAANRVDMKKRDPVIAARSQREFEAFISRGGRAARRTQMGQMIVEAVQEWQKPEVLVAPVLRMVAEIPPVPMNYRKSIVQHARFAETLAEIVRGCGATPLMYGD
ncbi:MAG: hypothetical protein WBP26_00285 [Candidatus Saccharimonadales bacterium]